MCSKKASCEENFFAVGSRRINDWRQLLDEALRRINERDQVLIILGHGRCLKEDILGPARESACR